MQSKIKAITFSNDLNIFLCMKLKSNKTAITNEKILPEFACGQKQVRANRKPGTSRHG